MRKHVASSLSFLVLLLLSHSALAGFYVVDDTPKPKATKTQSSSAKKTTTATKKPTPKPTKKSATTHKKPVKKVVKKHVKKQPKYSYIAHGNSLKSNIERVVKRTGWGQVVWDLPYDYRWVGRARFQGNSLQSVLRQVLVGYPVQAVFYEKNRVVVVKPRPVINYHAPPELIDANGKAAKNQESEYGHQRDPKDGPAVAKAPASTSKSTTTATKSTSTTQEAKHA